MATNNNGDMKLVIGGILGLILVNKVLVAFGLAKGQGTQMYETEVSDANSAFNTAYWRNFYYSGGTQPNGRKPITTALINRAKQAAKTMVNAFGYVTDDEDEVIQAIQLCGTKAIVSLMAFYIANDYKTSLLGLLKYGKNVMPENGLSESELQNIITMVKRLPNS